MTLPARSLYRLDDLAPLIDPAVIAVVGASSTAGAFGQRTLANLRHFKGKVFGINPKYQMLEGFPCLPNLSEMPQVADCVVICVARPLVQPVLREAAAIGVKSAIVYASGFAETGRPDRIAAQGQLVATARAGGIRFAGPNCVGIANVQSGAAANFMADCDQLVDANPGSIAPGSILPGSIHPGSIAPGGIAVVSQSGALGYSLLQGRMRGVGISHFLTAGNSADVDIADYIAALAEIPQVRAIACLFEGMRDGSRFLQAARLARDAGKALIVYKAGNTATSGRAALSHTGSLVGSVAAYRAAFEAVGAIQTDDMAGLLELAATFCKTSPPRAGRGVGIMATSGGAGVISADKAEQHGLSLPDLAPATRAILKQVVPDFGSVANPADLTAEVLKTSASFQSCVQGFADDRNFSAVVVPFVFAHALSSEARAPVLGSVAAATDCTIAAVWLNEWLEGPGSAMLDADPKVLMFRSAERCFAALRAWFDWHERGATPGAQPRVSAPETAERAVAMIAQARGSGKTMNEADAKRLLAAYGIRVPAESLAATPAAAGQAANQLGFPVAVKIASPDILHKTEVDGIRLNLHSAAEVADAARAVLAAAHEQRPDARIDGVSVQTMIPAGTELVLGIQRDQQFGPLMVVGLGGTLVELLRDVSTSLVPVGPDQALRMLRSLRGYALLTGHRGRPAADIESAVDAICRFSELAADCAALIEEADVNPLIVDRSGAIAADGLFVLG